MKEKHKNILFFVSIFIVLLGFFAWRNHSYKNFVEEFDFSAAQKTGLPVLLELGGKYCPACMAMKPVLKELDQKYSDDFAVAYIDANADSRAARKYNVSAIPVLIFMDKEGNKLHRYTGQMSENQIIQKWKDLGINLNLKK